MGQGTKAKRRGVALASAVALLAVAGCGGRAPEDSSGDEAHNGESPATDWGTFGGSDDPYSGWILRTDGEYNGRVETENPAVHFDVDRDDGIQPFVLDVPLDAELELNWHHHFSLVDTFFGLRFWARAGEDGPEELLVGVTGIDSSSTYTEDLANGHPWHVVRVPLGTEWEQHTVRFEDLAPAGEGDRRPMSDEVGGMIRLVVPPGQGGELWLGGLELGCVPGCPIQ